MAGTARGARTLGGDGGDDGGGRRRRGLLWLLLGLLALAIVVAILIALLSGGDDDRAARPADPAAPQQQRPQAGAAGAGEAGTLIAGGDERLLPTREATFDEGLAGQPARGTAVRVVEVVRDEGFFVGTGEDDRVYVEFGGDVGQNEQGAEVTNALRPGQAVDLTGEVRPAPEDPAQTLNLRGDDAELVRDQGVFVNAREVTPKG